MDRQFVPSPTRPLRRSGLIIILSYRTETSRVSGKLREIEGSFTRIPSFLRIAPGSMPRTPLGYLRLYIDPGSTCHRGLRQPLSPLVP
jgi:hypothetical protein